MDSTTTNTFANRLGYTDINPNEVVRVISDKCVEIRAMNAERNPNWKPEFVTGGFAGVCVNQNEQEWVITSNPESSVIRIRKHKDGRWYDSHRNRYQMSAAPRKFYDYNF